MSKVFCREHTLNKKLLEGIDILADNVASTMGPRGRTVIIHEKDRRPFATKDGVSVARAVNITDDPVRNVAVQIMKQAAEETANTAGDGTTTSTVLARSILVESQKYLAAGVSPIELKRGIDKVVSSITDELKSLSKPVMKLEDVKNVATISANNDQKIGELLAEAVDLTGKDGSVTIKEGKSLQTTLEVVEGFRIKGGIAAAQFITNERLGVMKHERPLFLITDERIEDIQQLMPTLELAAREKRPLIVVADDIFGEALAALIVNAMRGSMKVAAIKAPSYGKDRFNILGDLSLAVGATFITAQNGKTLTDVKLKDLGSAKTIESNKNWTTIVGGNGDPDSISLKIESLREEFKITEDMTE